jgi:methionyl-tRNA formyltransferase
MPLRLIFMGTPEFAVPTLLELVAHGHEIAAVYTRAAKPAGRGMKLQLTPVEQEARRLGIPVRTPTTLKTPEASEEFRAHNADAAVVVAYGMILPKTILEAPKLGCFNLHASLLPRWRGAAPINRAIMAGDAETGVMVMKMDAGLDTGDVAMAERIAITDAMTAADLHDALARLGGDLMVRAIGARRDLRRQDRKGRGADRLEQACARSTSPHPRAVAVSRRLVRDADRRRASACQNPALRNGGWLRCTGRCARRSSHGCLPAARHPHSRTAASRQGADEGRGIFARHAREGWRAFRMTVLPRLTLSNPA